MAGALLAPCLAVGSSPGESESGDFESAFTGRCLRIDLLHRGNASSDSYTVARVSEEPLWSGPRTDAVDDLNLGVARYRLVDAASGGLLFRRGYATVFLEWITTAPGRGAPRTFEEVVRIPEPKRPVDVVLDIRTEAGRWREVFRYRLDPGDPSIDRRKPRALGHVEAIGDTGDSRKRLDVLFLGDGYRERERGAFLAHAARGAAALTATEPFRSRRGDLNLWALHVASPRSGITDRARSGAGRDNTFGAHYHAFGLPRYVLTYEERRIREAAAQVPYDVIIILLNEERYGGGGIYNLWSTCAARNPAADYLLVHEFGHNFAALADEYYTSAVAYENVNPPAIEPWEPNITALHDPGALKWKALATPGVPLPTPWAQARFDEAEAVYQAERRRLRDAAAPERALTDLAARHKGTLDGLLGAEPHGGAIGAFEGGGYRAKGIYRPALDCIMFSRRPSTFCKVCEAHLGRVLDTYVR